MNHTAFFSAIKDGKIEECYLFEGPEEYIKQQALARLSAVLLPAGLEQMNLTELNNPAADELIASCETLPFMGEKRLIVVRECDLLVSGRKQEDSGKAEAFCDYLQRLSPSACLVFYIKGKADARKKLYLQLKKSASLVDFSPMSDAEAASWAQKSLRVMGKQLSSPAAQALIFTVGHDAALLRQEMEKLCAYAAERNEITQEDIDAVCVKSLECTVFQMVDAQVAGNARQALKLMENMIRGGEDRIGILAMLLRQYRILYHAKRLSDEGASGASVSQLLGIPPFAVSRTMAQAKRYTSKQLKSAYDYLFELEYAFKSGRVAQDELSEHALLTLEEILRK